MSIKVYSAAVVGMDAKIIDVEVDVSYGLRCFSIVGLPDKAIQEAKERTSAALKSAGFKSPHSQPERVLINLAPADLKKEGSLYDLPIALGYLLSSKQISFDTQSKLFIGELSLDGNLRPVKGVLALSVEAKAKNFSTIILPEQNAPEAGLIHGIDVIGAKSLNQVIGYLKGEIEISPFKMNKQEFLRNTESSINLGWIKGQQCAKRALEIAAGGGHNLLMIGPPGAGKTLLAQAICSILPRLSFEEALEVTKIYSISGLLPTQKPLINTRPFRAPHHTSSEVALIGGGNPPRPGEITLSHRGVLFLDEFPEFHRDVLESLRQPLEQGTITVLRSKHYISFPAQFTLICATNPCPCGYYNDPEKTCTCTNSQIRKYRRKLSGPLMDRIDLFIEVPALKYEKLVEEQEDPTIEIRKKIEKAREIQKQRFKASTLSKLKKITNSEMEIPEIKKYCSIPHISQNILKKCVDSRELSARGFHRVLKISRTIADLENSENIMDNHVSEALMYRTRKIH